MNLPDYLASALRALTADARLAVACSGGADSTALLHALAQLRQARERGLRALHVDHQLHADSSRWAEHCKKFCEALDVPIEIVRVQVAHDRGEGLEAAARRARYAAFAQALQPGEWLIVAHHRDDQVETVLLKLLRGAGPHGLGGMRERRALGGGMLWRPLLDVPRAVLRDYVAQNGVSFIDDPSNADTRLSRNFLRAEVIPTLLRHWPHAADSIAHSAKLCRETAALLDERAEAALIQLRDASRGTLAARGWSALPDALRTLVLERWLHGQDLSAPPPARQVELQRQIEQARDDREPRIVWPDGEIHLWRGALHAVRPLIEIPCDWETPWSGAPLQLPGVAGVLTLRPSRPAYADAFATLPSPLRVRFRRGGERIKPAGDTHTRELRDLFQRAGIPPWQRGHIPLIFDGDQLIAVGDLWISTMGKKLLHDIAAGLVWQRGRGIESIAALR